MQFSLLGNYCDPGRSPSSIKDERVGYRSVSWLDWAGFFERSLWFDDSYIHLYPVTLPLKLKSGGVCDPYICRKNTFYQGKCSPSTVNSRVVKDDWQNLGFHDESVETV